MGGDGLVILKSFEGMFAHPLNGLKGLKASIFLSMHFGAVGGGDSVTDCTKTPTDMLQPHMENYHY